MLRAVEIAAKGKLFASPNPYVGSVLVKNGRLIAEGAHLVYGGPHAEINALRSAGSRARGATLYTSLEPCSHWGKTPPCAEAVVQAGIKRVAAAMADPNPLVRGRGFKILRKAGVQVDIGVCEKEALDLNRSFIKFIVKKKPYVLIKAAISLDGKIATRAGDSKWISSEISRDFSHRLRSEADAVLVGAETVRRDNPRLTSRGTGRNPVRIVLTRGGKIPKAANIFNHEAPTWILKNQKIPELLNDLGSRNISRLLVEGGGEVAAQFIESGEADEFMFFVAPLLIGGRTAKTAFEGTGFSKIGDALKLNIVETRRIGPDIFIRALPKK